MNKTANIILVGFMGTGKSTAGRALARQLHRPFLDMDQLIEERAGLSISELFARHGEAHFRGLERELVRELAAREGLVIAAGGGVVLNPQNVRDYARTGLVVCLQADPAVILQRVSAATHRPLLEGGDKARQILALLDQRRALYEAIPHRVDTTTLGPEEVAARILALYAAPPPAPA